MVDFLTSDKYIPRPGLRQHAFDLLKSPKNVRIIILGQDPYPRAASACGLSFFDAQSKLLWDSA